MLEGVDLSPGVVTYCDLHIEPDIPLVAQMESLKEDLLQVSYPCEYTLDVGWYPEFSPEGEFVVVVVKGAGWTHPVSERRAGTLAELRTVLRGSASHLRSLSR